MARGCRVSVSARSIHRVLGATAAEAGGGRKGMQQRISWDVGQAKENLAFFFFFPCGILKVDHEPISPWLAAVELSLPSLLLQTRSSCGMSTRG